MAQGESWRGLIKEKNRTKWVVWSFSHTFPQLGFSSHIVTRHRTTHGVYKGRKGQQRGNSPDMSEHFCESTIKASNTSKSVFFTWITLLTVPIWLVITGCEEKKLIIKFATKTEQITEFDLELWLSITAIRRTKLQRQSHFSPHFLNNHVGKQVQGSW